MFTNYWSFTSKIKFTLLKSKQGQNNKKFFYKKKKVKYLTIKKKLNINVNIINAFTLNEVNNNKNHILLTNLFNILV